MYRLLTASIALDTHLICHQMLMLRLWLTVLAHFCTIDIKVREV